MPGLAGDGLFLTFEGGDGSGKSTQSALLTDWLTAQGRTVVHGRGAGRHRGRAADPRNGAAPPRRHHTRGPRALLYAADRAHNIATVVRPALPRGDIVIQDRYLDSSVAYQGAGRVLDPVEVRDLSLWATEGLLPHLTVLLDLDESIGRVRLDEARTRYDRLEAEGDDFHARVRAAYLHLAAAEPDRFLVLDATRPVDELAGEIRDRVSALLR